MCFSFFIHNSKLVNLGKGTILSSRSYKILNPYDNARERERVFVCAHGSERDVHVVKLMSTEEFSEIVVHLHPKGAAEARTSKIVVAKDLVLILKSDSAVKWRIGSWGIKGTVYVVAEHQVFPGSMPVFHLLQVQVRSLPLTLEELTSEVTDSNISTVIESWTVNRVNIMVVGEILGSNHYNVQSDGGSSRNKFSVGQDKAQPVLFRQTKLNTTAYPFTSWNHKIRNRNETGNVDENLTLELDSLTSLECRKNEIKVNFPKSSCMKIAAKLNGVNIGWLEVTLKDQECKARSNKTHYILETNLNSCGSSMVSDGRKYYYKNQVLFWAPVRPKGILGNQKDLRSEFDESFADDEDVISSDDGSGVGHHLKQVLANQQGITKSRLLFTQNILCVYNMTDGRSRPKEVNHPHVFHMDLYKDSNFQEELLRVNGSVEVLSQDNVYVKTAIEAGPDLFVVTDECWLSLTNNSFVITENREVLIQHSCSKHLSVGLLGVERHGSRSPEELSYPQRFFFHITQRWIGHKVFLHCRLAVCSNKANSPLHGVKQCIDPKDYCEGYDVKQVSESQTEQHFSVQVEGPIHVLPSRKTQGKDSTAPFLFNYLPVMDKNLDRISPVVKSDVRAGSCTSHVMMELSTAAIVGIAFASFLIGAGLVVVLWFIHLHTDPSQRTRARQQRDVRHRHHHSGYDLSGHSGSSTPSSQAPMTVHACA